MSHNRLIEVAWKLHQGTRDCPRGLIVNATRWLEDCYGKSPDWKTAFAIAVHYVVLALSQMETDGGEPAADYLALALQWNAAKDREVLKLVAVGRADPAASMEEAGGSSICTGDEDPKHPTQGHQVH